MDVERIDWWKGDDLTWMEKVHMEIKQNNLRILEEHFSVTHDIVMERYNRIHLDVSNPNKLVIPAS